MAMQSDYLVEGSYRVSMNSEKEGYQVSHIAGSRTVDGQISPSHCCTRKSHCKCHYSPLFTKIPSSK